MGLFSKKTCTCQQCGKNYEARLDIGNHLCSDCQNAKKEAVAVVSGYLTYAQRSNSTYDMEELSAIAAHRDGILEKYRNTDALTKEELKEAGNNYKKLSEDEAINILTNAVIHSLLCLPGTVLARNFFCPTGFDGVVVDAADVFAVGYTQDIKTSTINTETILCVAFTNDPYIPVFPVVYTGHIGLLSFSLKSKKGRQEVEEIFTHRCPNLTWPVTDLKQLKKVAKNNGFDENIDRQTMLGYISDISRGSGMFSTKNMVATLSPASLSRLASYGYLTYEEVNRLLKLDSVFSGTFWKDIKEKALNIEASRGEIN